jgi:ribosomal protein S18 acetylase RimI-like enzyme
VRIRPLTADDSAEWSRLRLEALECEPEAFSSSPEEHRALTMKEIMSRLGGSDGDSFVMGAFENGALVGMVGFHRERGPKSRHKGRIWGVYVNAQHRGHGIGRKLLQAVMERATRIDGIDQILVSFTCTQTAAAALYRSSGFESFGHEPRALKVGGRFIDEEHLALSVKRTPQE